MRKVIDKKSFARGVLAPYMGDHDEIDLHIQGAREEGESCSLQFMGVKTDLIFKGFYKDKKNVFIYENEKMILTTYKTREISYEKLHSIELKDFEMQDATERFSFTKHNENYWIGEKVDNYILISIYSFDDLIQKKDTLTEARDAISWTEPPKIVVEINETLELIDRVCQFEVYEDLQTIRKDEENEEEKIHL